MNVLALSDSLAPDDGVGVMTHAILSHWSRRPEAPSIELWLARRHPPFDPSRAAGLDVRVRLPPDRWSQASFLADLAERLRFRWNSHRAGSPSPTHVVAFKEAPHALLGFEEARRHRAPFVSIVHGTYGVRALRSSRHRARTLAMIRGSRATLAVSAFTREHLLAAAGEERDDLEQRIRVLPHGVATEHLALAPREAADDPPYVVTIAACKERKGLDLAYGALEPLATELPELHWRIVGREHLETRFARTLRERIERGPLGGRVHFEGRVSEEDKLAWLARARLHLFTPRTVSDGAFEGFGLPYLEAAALGVPSIGTRCSGAEEALRGGRLGRLVEPSAEALTAAIREVWSLRGEALEEERRRIRAHAALRTWDHVADELWAALVRGEVS